MGCGRVLLDRQGPAELRTRILDCVEAQDGNRVADLHLWSIGPGIWAVELAIVEVSPTPANSHPVLP